MRLVIEFDNFAVALETLTQQVNKINKADIEKKIQRPYYIVNANEVYTGKYFVLKHIDKRISLVLDRSFKLLVVDEYETDNCNLEYSYKLVGDTKKKYINSVSYRSNKFNSQLGHIEYTYGCRNASKGMKVKPDCVGFSGILVDDKVIDGICYISNLDCGTLQTQYKDKVIHVDINPVYNYGKWTHNFKTNTLLVGKYCKEIDANKIDQHILVKILQESSKVSAYNKKVEIACNDLEPNTTSSIINPAWFSHLRNAKEANKVYLVSKKYSKYINCEAAIAMYRQFQRNSILYVVFHKGRLRGIKIEDMIDNNMSIDNVSITDEYVEIMGIDGHFRYNIKDYYAYYKLTQAEQSLRYKTQKLIKPDVKEVVRENGELIALKLDSHILEIPKTCTEITKQSLTILPSNKILYVPSSVKECSGSPLIDTNIEAITLEEIIIEENMPQLLMNLLKWNGLNKDNRLKIKTDTLSTLDILAIYDTRPHIELEITDKNWKLSEIYSSKLLSQLRTKVKRDKEIYTYKRNVNDIIQEKIDRLEKFKGFMALKHAKSMQNLMDSLESMKK